jgi:transposase
MINVIIGRPKGGKNKKYSIDEKLRVVNRYLNEHISILILEKEENISHSVIHSWITKYLDQGIEGLSNKKKTGNKYAALHNSKSLTREEYLELENLKLKVEIERLKKGYMVKGAGANKEYVILKDVNSKSSKN